MYGAHMNRNMKNIIVNENILSYLYMFHMCFKQIKYVSRKYNYYCQIMAKKFVMDIISLPL
jgi:hypothetical protein